MLKLNIVETFFLEDALRTTAEKYEKLRLQRLNATKKWNNSHRDKVNEYNRIYQRKIYAKKKVEKECDGAVSFRDNPAQYKKYQADYRATAKLRKLPFFGAEIIL